MKGDIWITCFIGVHIKVTISYEFLNSTTEALILKKIYFLDIKFMLKILLC